MGGNALTQYGIITQRKLTVDYLRIANEIKIKVEFDLSVETFVPYFYRNKESHGDLDLLLKIDHSFNNKRIDIRNYIKTTFNVDKIHNNGGVYSFAYDNFQIDFIPIKESNWESAKVYFSFDPLGNLMGKIAKQIKFDLTI